MLLRQFWLSPKTVAKHSRINGFNKKTQKTPPKEIERELKSEENISLKSSKKNITTFDDHLIQRYGQIGTEKRTEFDHVGINNPE